VNQIDNCNQADNIKSYPLLLFSHVGVVRLTDTHLVGEWWTDQKVKEFYEVYEKNHRFTQEFWGGYMRHNEIWRKVTDGDGELLRDEFIADNHAFMMYSPMLPESRR
jgi:vancomycin resistance protein VanW